MMNICASANSKYSRYLYVMLLSLLENNKNENISIYIFQRDFLDTDKDNLKKLCGGYGQNITFLQIDEDDFGLLPTTFRYSLETYFRFKIIDMIPETENRILYLDVDIIVNGSLKELYNTELGHCYFAACTCMMEPVLTDEKRKLFNRYDDLRYFNAGVMVWNLEELRGKVSFNDFMQAGEKLHYNLPLVDQDVLNYLYYDKTVYLDPHKYNYLTLVDLHKPNREQEHRDAVILHFNWYNPWQAGPKSEIYRIWWRYAKLTPFYYDFLEEQLERTENYVTEFDKRLETEHRQRDYITNVLKMLCTLKGRGKLLRYLENRDSFCLIYGAGMLAEAFYNVLEYECAGEFVFSVIDRDKEGEFHNIRIARKCKDVTDNQKQYQLIVTPSRETEQLKEELYHKVGANVEVLTLEEFLRSVI